MSECKHESAVYVDFESRYRCNDCGEFFTRAKPSAADIAFAEHHATRLGLGPTPAPSAPGSEDGGK